ncbi:MAG: carboxypeptidase regulatory-like domain-containing protein [Candidatus Latescibacteria bacterium]|nr:carboxypeptidase regulatory-like domain-containing protein [Candidatus Latescibacterota bacterium]
MNIARLFAVLDAAGFKTMQTLISISWQTLLLFGFTSLIVFVLRKSGTAFRHLIWTSFLCLLPVIPLIVWIASVTHVPMTEIPLIPSYTAQYQNQRYAETVGSTSDSNMVSISHQTVNILHYPWVYALAVYVTGVLFFLSTIVVSRARMRQWKKHGIVITDKRICDAFKAASVQLKVNRSLTLIETIKNSVPLTIGTYHPVILLPFGFTDNLNDVELHSLAVHECAHIKRYDSLIFTITVFIRALLFFHPSVWYAARKVSVLAERVCDDAVVDVVRKPIDYAELLTRMAKTLQKNIFTTEMAAGFFISKHDFLHRVEAILNERKKQFFVATDTIFTGISFYITAMLILTLLVPLGEVKSEDNKFDLESQNRYMHMIASFDPVDKTQAITISGRVIDANGNPVSNATVAPVLTGKDDFSGDTRFNVITDQNGNYTIVLPSNGEFYYNLMAHDGVIQGWESFARTWANGVTDSFIKNPGETINNLTIKLSRPCTVRGTVRDKNGKPMENHPVRAYAADGKGNRYFDPKTYTDAEGNFTLTKIRPGTNLIYGTEMLAPEKYAPENIIQRVDLKAGEVRDNIILLGMTKEEVLKNMRPPE